MMLRVTVMAFVDWCARLLRLLLELSTWRTLRYTEMHGWLKYMPNNNVWFTTTFHVLTWYIFEMQGQWFPGALETNLATKDQLHVHWSKSNRVALSQSGRTWHRSGSDPQISRSLPFLLLVNRCAMNHVSKDTSGASSMGVPNHLTCRLFELMHGPKENLHFENVGCSNFKWEGLTL